MKNTKYFLSTLVLAGVMAGCSSSWDQDPLAKKNNVLKDGQRNPTKNEKPDAESSENLRLTYPANPFFEEGKEGEIPLSGRALKPGYTARIIIENMSDFQGARTVVDAVTKDIKFVWNPPVGTVIGADGKPREYKILKVLVLGEKTGEGVLRRPYELKIEVTKELNAPEISISNTNITVREGDVATVSFQVIDKDAGSDPLTWPTIEASGFVGPAKIIVPYVSISDMSPVPMSGGKFSVSLKIDLKDAELTKGKELYGMSLKAVSRFQKRGMAQNVWVNVLNTFADMQSTWFQAENFTLGVKDQFQFLIYDPKEEGIVGTPTFTGVPAGASFSCSGVGVYKQLCTMTWAPDFMSSPGDFTVRANVVLTNQDDRSQTKNQTFDLRMIVNDAPPVSISRAGGN